MKNVITAVSLAILLTACGGSGTTNNPFEVIQNDEQTTTNAGTTIPTEIVGSAETDGTTGGGNTENQAPAGGSTNETPAVPVGATPIAATAGECIDTGAINDGYGWNGVSSCQLPIITAAPEPAPAPAPQPEPAPEPVPVYTMTGPFTGTWYCEGDVMTLNSDMTVGVDGLATWWVNTENSISVTYDRSGTTYTLIGDVLSNGLRNCLRTPPVAQEVVQLSLTEQVVGPWLCSFDGNNFQEWTFNENNTVTFPSQSWMNWYEVDGNMVLEYQAGSDELQLTDEEVLVSINGTLICQ